MPNPGVTPLIAVCAAAAFGLPALCLGLWVVACRYRRNSEREFSRLQQMIDGYRTTCARDVAGIARNLEALEASMQTSDELLRAGRLSHSCRVQALQLLRAGIAPDTAAVTLGIPNRDVRLLAKVSRLLIAP